MAAASISICMTAASSASGRSSASPISRGFRPKGRVMISHAYCLGMVARAHRGVGRRLADQGISLMTSAPADMAIPPVAFPRDRRHRLLRFRRHPRCVVADGKRRHAGACLADGLPVRLGKDEELLDALDAVTIGRRESAGACGLRSRGRPAGGFRIGEGGECRRRRRAPAAGTGRLQAPATSSPAMACFSTAG